METDVFHLCGNRRLAGTVHEDVQPDLLHDQNHGKQMGHSRQAGEGNLPEDHYGRSADRFL
ncbi:hypothetical protein D3C71_2167490 [compost metagenome]